METWLSSQWNQSSLSCGEGSLDRIAIPGRLGLVVAVNQNQRFIVQTNGHSAVLSSC